MPESAREAGVLGYVRTHSRTLLFGLVSLGIALRVLLIAGAPQPYGYIYDFYHTAVEITYWQRRLPFPTECGECYQPPLFYLLSAPLFFVGRVIQKAIGPSPWMELRVVSLLPVACGALCVWYGHRILRWLEFDVALQVLGTGLLLLLPVLFFSTHGIESDVLLGALMTALLYYGLQYSNDVRYRTSGQAAVLGLCAGLSAATKYSGLIGVAFTGVLLAEQIWKTPRSRAAWRHVVTAVTLIVVLGSWKYVDNILRYGNPLFANGTALQGFALTSQSKAGHYEWFTFRLPMLLEMAGPNAKPGRLTDLPIYRSFWTSMYGMSWNDLGMFSNPTRHGDPTRPYGWRYVPPPVAQSVLVLGLVPTALALIGFLSSGLSRASRPLLILTILTAVSYLPWVARQDEWAIKPKYLLFLAPVYAAFAVAGLQFVQRRLPQRVTDLIVVSLLALFGMTAVYLACFSIGL